MSARQVIKPSTARQLTLRLLLVLLLLLAALWAAVWWVNHRSEQQGLEELRRETAALALLFATHADTTFRTVDLALKELRRQANRPAESITEAIAPHLQLLQGAVVQTAIVNAQGQVVYSTPIPPTQATFVLDREFFQVHQQKAEDALFVGRPLKGRLSDRWSIHLSRPILEQGRFAGVVVIGVDPDHFVKFYQMAGLGGGGAARMIRDTGEVMARSSEQEKFIGKVINPSPYADPGAPAQGSFRRLAQVDGVDRLSSYQRLPEYGLTVVIGPSVDERLATVRAQQRQLVWAAVVISGLMVLIFWLMRQSMVRTETGRLAMENQFEEILALKELLLEQALHDPLTRLNNRRFLAEALPRELARAKREGSAVSLIVFDLDHFKRVNDTHGHAAGDKVLVRIAQLLVEHARESDIVCRYGGEEFLMALSGTTAEQAVARAESIRAIVEQLSIDTGSAMVELTISAGIAAYPQHGGDVGSLFSAADQALYAAKREGRNRVVCAPAGAINPPA